MALPTADQRAAWSDECWEAMLRAYREHVPALIEAAQRIPPVEPYTGEKVYTWRLPERGS